MTSRTTKQAARAYQRAQGVPYAEARRRVMGNLEITFPPTRGNSSPSQPRRTSKLLLGYSPESGSPVEWSRRPLGVKRLPELPFNPPVLGVYGATRGNRTALLASLIRQTHPSPVVIIADAARLPEYTERESSGSSLDVAHVLEPGGEVSPSTLRAAIEGVALVGLDVESPTALVSLLRALHELPRGVLGPAVIFTSAEKSDGFPAGPAMDAASPSLQFCTSLVSLLGHRVGMFGHVNENGTALSQAPQPFTGRPPADPDIRFSLTPLGTDFSAPGRVVTMYADGLELGSKQVPNYPGSADLPPIPDAVLGALIDRAAVSLAHHHGYRVTVPEWML